MGSNYAVKVKDVHKQFILPHEKTDSVKRAFTNIFNVNRSTEVQQALKGVSFEIKEGEFFGIVGRNGSGKSTLLKMLAGIYQPTKGTVEIRGKLVPFIELGVGFNPELTGRENVYLNGALLGFSKKEIDAQYDDIVRFAELERFMDQKLKNYSSGMQVRLAFSVAIVAEADILLVDEVLAVGDAAFQRKCYSYFRDLKRQGKTVVFVSHDMSAVREYCDRAILIENSELILNGTSQEVASAYARMFAEEGQEKQQQGTLRKKKKRWGSGKVTYESVTIEPKISDDYKPLRLVAKAIVAEDVDEAILGFKVKIGGDTPTYGSNTKIKRIPLVGLKKGDQIEVTWKLPNIMNEGNHTIDVVAEGQDYSEVYDSWEDAAGFQVIRDEPNPYAIHPEVSAKVDLVRATKKAR